MLEELAPRWQAARESALHERRGGDRRRAAGAGPKQCLVFVDRLLGHAGPLAVGIPHAALAELYGVDRSTVSGAIREVRPLLATRGFAVPDRPGVRLRTLEDLFSYASAQGVDLRIDGTEVQVRRPRAHRPGRKAFASGKKKQNTIKTTTFSDPKGRALFSGAVRPGRALPPTMSGPERRFAAAQARSGLGGKRPVIVFTAARPPGPDCPTPRSGGTGR
ncbi:transposase family protein [Streptomyces sp. NPDC054783]